MRSTKSVLRPRKNNTSRVIEANISTPRVFTNCVQSEPVKTVGERIRQAREARGLTQAELATRVGFKNQSAIGNLEARATGRGGFKISQIAQVLMVPVEWLLEGPDTGGLPTLQGSTADTPAFSSTTISEPISSYRPSEREIAISLVRDLPNAALREAIDHLQYLITKHSRTEQRAGLPVPAPKAA